MLGLDVSYVSLLRADPLSRLSIADETIALFNDRSRASTRRRDSGYSLDELSGGCERRRRRRRLNIL